MNINATLLGQALTFAILIWFTMKFVWPPLVKALDERAHKISEGLAAAERGKQDLIKAEKLVAIELDQAKQQVAEITAQGEKRATAIIEEAKNNARVEAERIIASAKAEIAQEAQRAKDDLRNQVAILAVIGVEKILKREVDQKVHADILNDLKTQF